MRCGTYGVLVEKPEGKKPIGRPGLRSVDNTKMCLQELGYRDMDGIAVAQDRDRDRDLVNAGMNIRVPCNTGDFLTS